MVQSFIYNLLYSEFQTELSFKSYDASGSVNTLLRGVFPALESPIFRTQEDDLLQKFT